MDKTAFLLAGMVGPCPRCGNGRLEPVHDGQQTNLFCSACGSCWQVERDWVHRTDPEACPGCAARERCLMPTPPGPPTGAG